MLNWLELRRLQAADRAAKQLEVAELAERIGVAATTIYRIENLKENPDHRPELQTIVDWLRETDGPSLAAFFAQVDGRMTPPVAAENDNDPATSTVSGARDHHGSGSVSSPDAVALADLRAFIANLSVVLATAAAGQIPRGQVSSPGAEKTKRGDVSA